MATNKHIWMEQTYQSKLSPETARVYDALPDEVRRSLAAAAFNLYDFGFQHGRSFSGCGTEPVYFVPEPYLQITDRSTDIA